MNRYKDLIPNFLLLYTCILLLGSCQKAGLGGKSNVSVFVKHHGAAIPGSTVYVKFNETEFPGKSANYDLTFTTSVSDHAKGHCHVDELKAGNYFFYAAGFDSSIREPVTGGIALKIKRSQKNEDIEIEIPVTE